MSWRPRTTCVLCKAAWGPTGHAAVRHSPSCSSETPAVAGLGRAAGCALQRHSLTQMCVVVSRSGQVFFPGGRHVWLLHACTRPSPCPAPGPGLGYLQQTKAGYWQWRGGHVWCSHALQRTYHGKGVTGPGQQLVQVLLPQLSSTSDRRRAGRAQ